MGSMDFAEHDSGLRHLSRVIVFLPGMLLGLSISANTSYFGGGSTMAKLSLIYIPLALCLSAPVCWILAARTESRDRWTIGYAIAWVSFLTVMYALTWIF